MKQLRMYPEYVKWTWQGMKWATTRLKPKDLMDYSLVSGSYCNPVHSGIVIELHEIWTWTRETLPENYLQEIIKAENFPSKEDFFSVLASINKIEILPNTRMFTHFYEVKHMKVDVSEFTLGEVEQCIKRLMERKSGGSFQFKRDPKEGKVYLHKFNGNEGQNRKGVENGY